MERCLSPDVLYGSAGSILGCSICMRRPTSRGSLNAVDPLVAASRESFRLDAPSVTWCSDREKFATLWLSHGNAGVALASHGGSTAARPAGLDHH